VNDDAPGWSRSTASGAAGCSETRSAPDACRSVDAVRSADVAGSADGVVADREGRGADVSGRRADSCAEDGAASRAAASRARGWGVGSAAGAAGWTAAFAIISAVT
jgi:hypothetical protein